MNKETTLKIIEAIRYIADVDIGTALGYSGVFEEICEDYHQEKVNKRNAPNKIYLNVGFDKEVLDLENDDIDFNELVGVNWSTKRLSDNDIEYSRVIKLK